MHKCISNAQVYDIHRMYLNMIVSMGVARIFWGETLFQKIFKKFSKNIQKICKKYSKNIQKKLKNIQKYLKDFKIFLKISKNFLKKIAKNALF